VRLKTTLPSIRVFEKLQNDASEQIIKAIDDAIKSIKDERVAIENMRALDLLFKKRLASLDEKRKVVNFGLALDFTIQALRFNIQAAENKAKYEESKK
jgi:hypothetical protein